jgi:hypothetical protein
MKRYFIGLAASLMLLLMACNQPAGTGVQLPPTPKPILEPGKTTEGGEPVKKAVEQLLDLAKVGDCAAMAPLLALRQSNTDQDWKRGMRYDTPTERAAVDKQCAQLQVIMTGLKAHTYKEFAQEKESEGEWNIWTVEMLYEDGSQEDRAFAFLRNGNGFILGDID